MTFSSNTRNWTDTAENCFETEIETNTAILSLSGILNEAFSLEIDKKKIISVQKDYLRMELGITREGLFSQTSVKRVISSRKKF